jgi:peptide-methionine (S)-S-oxide reductase
VSRNGSVGTATFAGGCFWQVEAALCGVPGVFTTSVGYPGGTKPFPSYEEVATGATGHAEAVQVEFDPQRVSYDELLEHFWRIHDPTRARGLVGRRSQYRSAIFAHSPEQLAEAEASRSRRRPSSAGPSPRRSCARPPSTARKSDPSAISRSTATRPARRRRKPTRTPPPAAAGAQNPL